MKRREALKYIGSGVSASMALPWLSSCEKDSVGPLIDFAGNIAVIGAGASGLYAADYLLSRGINTVVFEASDRIGGRIRTLRPTDKPTEALWFNEKGTLSSAFPIELGADRIYGTDSVWAGFVQQQTFPTLRLTDFENDLFWINNQLLDFTAASQNADFNLALNFYNDLVTKLNAGATVQQAIELNGIPPSTHGFLNAVIGNRLGSSNSRIGASGLAESFALRTRNNDQLLISNNPMADVLINTFIRAAEKTELNTVISGIDYSGEKIILTGEKKVGGSAQSFTFEADKVILTVPLAVIKANDITFNPPMPSAKTSAMEMMGVDNAIRVVLDFRQDFWGPAFQNIYGGAGSPAYFNSGRGRADIPRALHVIVSGEKAEEYATLGLDVVTVLLEDLDSMYGGNATKNIRRDAEEGDYLALIHNWGKEPFIKGNVSYLLPGGSNAHRQALASSVEDKLYFAGEATDFSGDAGTVSGALISGERAAKEVIESITG